MHKLSDSFPSLEQSEAISLYEQKIATHLSGTRNDGHYQGFCRESLNLGNIIVLVIVEILRI